MRRPKKDIQLTSYDELLGLEETPEKSMNQVVEINLNVISVCSFDCLFVSLCIIVTAIIHCE